MNTPKNIISNPNQCQTAIAGTFFQPSKICITRLRELTRNNPLSILVIDIFPKNEELIQQKIALSYFERIQFFAQLGVKNVISVDVDDFDEIKAEIENALKHPGNILNEIIYLCGLSEKGIELFKPNNLSPETNISPDNSFIHNLGFLYPLSGTVITGNQMGRTIGYPTANLQVDDKNKILPPMGVYSGWAKVDDNWHKTMVNIGVRPTLNLKNLAIESHLIGFEGSLYGRTISLHLHEKIRNEMRFASLQLLKEQLEKDKLSTIKSLDNLNHTPNKDDFLIFA